MSYTSNLCVLICNAFLSVYKKNCNITAFNSCNSSNNTKSLYLILNLTLTTKTSRIYKDILTTISLNLRIYSISGSTSNIRYNESICSKELVNKRRLSCIWLTYNCNPRNILRFFLSCILRELSYNLFKHITYTKSISSRNRHRITYTKIIELIYIVLELLKTIRLVNSKNNRFLRSSKKISNQHIWCCNAITNVCDKYYNIGSFYSYLSLFSHGTHDNIFRLRFYTACIYYCKTMIQPLNIRIYSISCNAWSILNYRKSLSSKHIKECRFSNIWTPNYGNNFLSHSFFLIISIFLNHV